MFECNNGYRCGCCRREWTDVDIQQFGTDKQAVEYAKGFDEDKDERRVTAVYKLVTKKSIL